MTKNNLPDAYDIWTIHIYVAATSRRRQMFQNAASRFLFQRKRKRLSGIIFLKNVKMMDMHRRMEPRFCGSIFYFVGVIKLPQIKMPKGEIVWEQIYSNGDLVYVITSKLLRDTYYLYRNESGVLKKLGKAKTPVELREKYCTEVS